MLSQNDKTKELESYTQTVEHIHLVASLLSSASLELTRRALTHDQSKLVLPEVKMFAEITQQLNNVTYGSPEYENCRKKMLGLGLRHHYSHNRHHPEFFEEQPESEELNDYIAIIHRASRAVDLDESTATIYRKLIEYLKRKQAEQISSINNMSLFDLLEMLIDWIASTERHADGDIEESIRINRDRFFMGKQLIQVFKNTIPWIKNDFAKLKTQRDL